MLNDFTTFNEISLLLTGLDVFDVTLTFIYNHISSAVLKNASEEPDIIRDKTPYKLQNIRLLERTELLLYLIFEKCSKRLRSATVRFKMSH